MSLDDAIGKRIKVPYYWLDEKPNIEEEYFHIEPGINKPAVNSNKFAKMMERVFG
jgi:hypothetical protein